jgi:hypothetical protein
VALPPRPNKARVGAIIRAAKQLAKRYRHETGRPLGITGEVAEYEAARLLRLELAPVRQAGYDVIRRKGKRVEKLQVKGRSIPADAKPGQRLGSIKPDHAWHGVLLVLLDEDLEPTAIYEARRARIAEALQRPGSKARNERGALSVSKFRSIAKLRWQR